MLSLLVLGNMISATVVLPGVPSPLTRQITTYPHVTKFRADHSPGYSTNKYVHLFLSDSPETISATTLEGILWEDISQAHQDIYYRVFIVASNNSANNISIGLSIKNLANNTAQVSGKMLTNPVQTPMGYRAYAIGSSFGLLASPFSYSSGGDGFTNIMPFFINPAGTMGDEEIIGNNPTRYINIPKTSISLSEFIVQIHLQDGNGPINIRLSTVWSKQNPVYIMHDRLLNLANAGPYITLPTDHPHQRGSWLSSAEVIDTAGIDVSTTPNTSIIDIGNSARVKGIIADEVLHTADISYRNMQEPATNLGFYGVWLKVNLKFVNRGGARNINVYLQRGGGDYFGAYKLNFSNVAAVTLMLPTNPRVPIQYYDGATLKAKTDYNVAAKLGTIHIPAAPKGKEVWTNEVLELNTGSESSLPVNIVLQW